MLRAALARLREGTYRAGSHTVYYQDHDTVRAAADLYAVLKEEAENGSPNLENKLARSWLEQMQSGQLLSNEQLAKLLELERKYGDQLRAYREGSDRSQDILDVPDGARARIIK